MVDAKVAIGFGIAFLLIIVISAWFFPAIFLAVFFVFIAIAVAVFAPGFVATTPGLILVVVLIIIGALFGLLAVGNQASLSAVGAIRAI